MAGTFSLSEPTIDPPSKPPRSLFERPCVHTWRCSAGRGGCWGAYSSKTSVVRHCPPDPWAPQALGPLGFPNSGQHHCNNRFAGAVRYVSAIGRGLSSDPLTPLSAPSFCSFCLPPPLALPPPPPPPPLHLLQLFICLSALVHGWRHCTAAWGVLVVWGCAPFFLAMSGTLAHPHLTCFVFGCTGKLSPASGLGLLAREATAQ